MDIVLTVDMEPDCPPFLNTFKGIEQGTEKLLSLFGRLGVPATFFFTGMVAQAYPHIVKQVLDAGHEIGCHGDSHTPFTQLDRHGAAKEITDSLAVLRRFERVVSFRAPNLVFPEIYLNLLAENGILIDSSLARYKMGYLFRTKNPPVKRLPVSATSSVLRLPGWIRTPYLGALSSPMVLFVHPWEFVDFRHTNLRLDCRFKTGDMALDCLEQVISGFDKKNGPITFKQARDYITPGGGKTIGPQSDRFSLKSRLSKRYSKDEPWKTDMLSTGVCE